ncbi:rare lipoprotein A [Escherichia coli]|nr:rare lipoprotein A [Escherichia coli]
MRKQWLGICIAAGMLAACTSDDGQQQTVSVPQPAVCNGPIVEISGADPRFEPLNATANQDYQRDGKSYKIVQDPSRFSQAGLAAIYDAEPGSNLTASGEAFDPTQLTASPSNASDPSYARITNLANGRMIVVRINDRGPYGKTALFHFLARQLTVLTRQTTPSSYRSDYCCPGWFAFWSWYGLYHSRQTDLRPACTSRFKRWRGNKFSVWPAG